METQAHRLARSSVRQMRSLVANRALTAEDATRLLNRIEAALDEANPPPSADVHNLDRARRDRLAGLQHKEH